MKGGHEKGRGMPPLSGVFGIVMIGWNVYLLLLAPLWFHAMSRCAMNEMDLDLDLDFCNKRSGAPLRCKTELLLQMLLHVTAVTNNLHFGN